MIQLQDFNEPEALQHVEIDKAIDVMKNIFKDNLTWLSNPYGRSYKYNPEDLGGRTMPYVYIGNTDGRYSLTSVSPDNDKKGVCFFIVGPEKPVNYDQYHEGFMRWELGIVFWVNMELINKELSKTEDFTQNLIREVRRVIRSEFLGLGFSFEIKEIIRDFIQVFREFDIKEKKTGIMPYSCFRINADVVIKEDCGITSGGK